MSKVGDYVHYYTKNYKKFGTTEKGPSNYGEGPSVISKQIKESLDKAKNLRRRYRDDNLIELENFMNSIFYPKEDKTNTIRDKQFEQMKKYVEQEFQRQFNGFTIDWKGGMNVRATGPKSISKNSQIQTLYKLPQQLESAFERARTAKTRKKIEEAMFEVQNAIKILNSLNEGASEQNAVSKVHINTKFKNIDGYSTENLIEKVNTALSAVMYNNAAIGYVFELALSTFSGQVKNEIREISTKVVDDALKASARSNPNIKIDLIDENFFDKELFGNLINKNNKTNLGVWQMTPDGTGFEFSAPTQDKLDVALSFDGEMYNISAKNYSNITKRDIHIVQGSSLLQMLLNDSANVDFINHYLNLTSSTPGLPGSTLIMAHQAMKLNILLKSLTGLGTSQNENLADILVINDRRSRHIYIRSIGDLVLKISENLNKIDEYMKIGGLGKNGTLNIKNDYVGNINVPNEKNARIRITKLLAQLHNTKINVSIKKNVIYNNEYDLTK